jgi:vitamin B12 transporter
MSKLISVSFALGLVALASPVALAQEGGDRSPPDTIIVTADRLGTPLDASTSAVTILDEEDLERRQSVFVVDALSALAGVSVAQNGAFGGTASVRIRGAASEQALVLIDGVVVNDPTSPGGGFNAAFLDTNAVARIEVLRGPQSTLWGSDAIGGVINIITRRPDNGSTGVVNLEAGSFGTVRAAGSYGFGGDSFDLRLGAALIGSDGISKADEADGNPEADDYDGVTLDGRAGINVTPVLRVEGFARYGESRAAYDGYGFVTGVADSDEIERSEEANGGLIARLRLFDGRFESVALASRASFERRYFSSGAPTFEAEGSRETLRYQGTVRPHEGFTVAFGAEREDSDFQSLGETSTEGLFALAEAEAVAGLTLTVGWRRDDHSTFGGIDTRRLGVRWSPIDGFGARASWGQGFKAPTVFQVSGGGFVPANPNLQPEEAEGWDAALFFDWLDGRIAGEVGVFALDTTNLIRFSSLGYVNLARAESRGAEAALQWAVFPGLTVAANYTYTDAINGVTGGRLSLSPEHMAFVEADWRATPLLGLTVSVRYNGEEADTNFGAFSPVTNAAWTRVDIGGRYRLSERLEVYARIENVFDERYQDVYGYGAPGLSAYGGVRVRFE